MVNRQNHYTAPINTVTTYISENIAKVLRLEDLARIAGFSPYHFHRIFKTVTGENLNEFVVRRRLERAVALMRAQRSTHLTRIALECGYSELSDFSRVFKQRFGIAPSAWDRRSSLQLSKISQASASLARYTADELGQMAASRSFDVQVRDIPEQSIAYVRVTNAHAQPQAIVQAFKDLTEWSRNRAMGGTLIGMSEDDPEVTPPEKYRYDVCLTVQAATKPEPPFSIRTLPGHRAAVIHCVGDMALINRAWQYLYRHWLPESGYLPDNMPAMEIYVRTPDEIGWETFDLDCAIAVIPIAT